MTLIMAVVRVLLITVETMRTCDVSSGGGSAKGRARTSAVALKNDAASVLLPWTSAQSNDVPLQPDTCYSFLFVLYAGGIRKKGCGIIDCSHSGGMNSC
jgi:hypothetical protein